MYSDTSLLQLLDQPGESGSLFSEDWDGVLSDEGDVALYTVQEFGEYRPLAFRPCQSSLTLLHTVNSGLCLSSGNTGFSMLCELERPC